MRSGVRIHAIGSAKTAAIPRISGSQLGTAKRTPKGSSASGQFCCTIIPAEDSAQSEEKVVDLILWVLSKPRKYSEKEAA